ncbi:MAG: MerR family transcriptional regulator [Candidatus Omnitrophica bacterium]|nr:MerR family transcriptional regulator [Candidatus Omnitrophota bacterium]
MTTKFITVKEIAKKFGFSYQTINRYSDVGLLPVIFKKGNIRYYDRHIVEKRMKHILSLAKEGYSLMLIRKKLLGI